MDEARRAQIYNDLNLRETEDLVEIWKRYDLEEWEEEVFEIIRAILLERLGTVPQQDTQAQVNEILKSIDSHYRAGEYERALNECQLVLQLAPALATAYTWRGLIYNEMGQLEQAITDYQKAIRLDPEEKDAWYYMKGVEKILEERFQHSSAKRHLDQALEYTYGEEPGKALGECALAQRTLPGIANAYNYMGLILEGLNRLDFALEAYLEAIRLNPRYFTARENLANVRKKLEKEQYRQAAHEEGGETQEGVEAAPDLDELWASEIPENTDSAPGWLYMDEKAFLLTGWPGHRTRQGRSGYDPLELDFESAHMIGEFTHLSFTGKFRINNPFYLLLMTIVGLICCLPLLFVGITLPQGNLFSVYVAILYSPYWIVGVAFLTDVFLSLRMSGSEKYIQNDNAFY